MMNQMMNPDFNASREAMLREVDQAGFAVVDANLYLCLLYTSAQDDPHSLQPGAEH